MRKMKSTFAAPALWLSVVTLYSLCPAASAMAQDDGAQYVAMGSSFAAGPGVEPRDESGPPDCARSSRNYAHLLAAKRGLSLNDVSCSGSTTANILSTPQAGAPPEIDSVGPSTRLVTLTIGGNDVGYLGELIRLSCLDDPTRTPASWRPRVCRPAPTVDVERGFAALPGRLQAIAAAIRARAPQATIVFVDYVAIVPVKGACPARLPLTAAHITRFNAVAARLAAITAEAARSTGSILVRASALSAGHDVCSKDSWVSPYLLTPSPQAFGSPPYHPNLKAMTAIAAAIDAALPPASLRESQASTKSTGR